MNGHTSERPTWRAFLRSGLAVVVVSLALLLPRLGATPALAADEPLAKADQACLACHRSPRLTKKMEDGETLSLHVDPDPFAQSVHRAIGCAGCHADIDLVKHRTAGKVIASARAYKLEKTEVCRTCHSGIFDKWDTSIHAAMVRAGSPAAPVCTDCHSPHAVIKDAATQIDQVPCKKCHEKIYTAFLGSMHGQALTASSDSSAPLCSSCHGAHDVKPTVLGEGPTAACSACHADEVAVHQRWLPNAALHFQAVSCPACHSPTAERRVDLLLVDSHDATRTSDQIGVPLIRAGADSDGQGLDAATLWNLLQTLNRSGTGERTLLRGRLEVSTPVQAHQLADKSKALSDCETCHSAGSQAFQSVTISLAGPDGRRVRYGANADVLSSVISLDTVGGFYAIGGTRIRFLDVLLILAVLAGVAVPLGHMTMGWIFRHYFLNHAPGGGDRPPGGGSSTAA
jgi:hypothetical protein